jgi:hypothetical protein
MKFIKYLLIGIAFGFAGTKSEIISWYRIHEMFHFESFHMYGVIGSAVVLGIIITAIIKKVKMKDLSGNQITFADKNMGFARYFVGGSIFGLGWAMTGACPGPIYALIGNGYLVYIVVFLAALLGTFTYGVLRDKLPH